MTVVERTSGGYTKIETKNGNIRYRDPNGHGAKQEQFAASKGGEATAEKYDPERDPDTGEITGLEPSDDGGGGGGDGDPVSRRVTATVRISTDNVSHSGDTTELGIEIGGSFPESGPTNSEIVEKVNSITESAKEQVPIRESFDRGDVNIERHAQMGSPKGWVSGQVSINNQGDWSPDPYRADPEQEKITDNRWDP